MDRFINILKARIATEEAYVASLHKILKTTEPTETTPLFGEKQPSFLMATYYYEQSIDKVAQQRRELIQSLKAEVEKLTVVKDRQEVRRKHVKTYQGDKNANYSVFRTTELVKLKKTYNKKCTDYETAQQQFEELQQQQQQQLQQQQYQRQHLFDDQHYMNDPYSPHSHQQHNRPFEDLKRLSSDSLDANGDTASINSQHDNSTYKKGMANFMASMAQVRTQFANVTQAAATPDMSKQNARFAKFKKEIAESDQEYRKGIRTLERLRKEQVIAAGQTMKQLEIAIMDKAEVTFSALSGILEKEKFVLQSELKVNDICQQYTSNINSDNDYKSFNNYYKKLPFRTPEPIQYSNFYMGPCRYILFGGSLIEYSTDFNRNVPLLVTKCIESVDNMGLQKEGIYRVSGRQSNIEALKHAFEENEEMEIDKKYDVFTIATVLKIYLRELEEPLLKIDMQKRIQYTELRDKQRQLLFLQTILSGLPKSHRETLYVVIRHIANVNANSATNKMNLQNLSVIFTPAIFHDFNQAENPGEWHADTVFEDLVTYYEPLFTQAEIQSRGTTTGPQPLINTQDYQPTHHHHNNNTSENNNNSNSSSGITVNTNLPGLLLTAPMGTPPIISNEPPTPTSTRKASLAALSRSGSLRPASHNNNILNQQYSNNQDYFSSNQQYHQQYYNQSVDYQYQQQQQQQSPYSYQQQQQQRQPLPPSSSSSTGYHNYSSQSKYEQETTPLSPSSQYPTSSYTTTTIPEVVSLNKLTINTDTPRFDLSDDGEKTMDEHSIKSPLVDDQGSMKSILKNSGVVPPRQDSLRTKGGGGSSSNSNNNNVMIHSTNSSTSSLQAAVNQASILSSNNNNNTLQSPVHYHPPSASNLSNTSLNSNSRNQATPSPTGGHQPILIESQQQHLPSSAQIISTTTEKHI
ncbi:unnamed protein product [Cunninghamella blakesleeana]